MQKRAPTLGNILVIILFALSCFGLLLFLWESFGGPVPLKPKGYRFTIAFPRTLALAEQSDVRISGVNVGHVVALNLGKDGLTHATVELGSQYSPIRENMHAILRQKSLLGETYVQLIPQQGGHSGPYLADNSQLPNSQVEPSVTLDDILATFDAKTRHDFQLWQESVAVGINHRGEEINGSFAQLEPFVSNGNRLVTLLASQEGALKALIKNTGVVFNALGGRDHQLESMIVNGEHTFRAASAASKAFAEAFEALPTFEKNSTVALKELDKFATISSPYLDEFKVAQKQLTKTLQAAKPFVPEFNAFLTAIGPLTNAARTGLPALKPALQLTVPVLEASGPVLHNLDPFLQYTGEYTRELQAFFANVTAASAGQFKNTNTEGEGPKERLLTTMAVLSPESLALYPSRVGTNRANPYQHAGAYSSLASGLPVFSSSACANSAPAVSGPTNETITEAIIEQIIQFHVANKPESPNEVQAPACAQQGPFAFNGETSQFPHVVYKPSK